MVFSIEYVLPPSKFTEEKEHPSQEALKQVDVALFFTVIHAAKRKNTCPWDGKSDGAVKGCQQILSWVFSK